MYKLCNGLCNEYTLSYSINPLRDELYRNVNCLPSLLFSSSLLLISSNFQIRLPKCTSEIEQWRPPVVRFPPHLSPRHYTDSSHRDLAPRRICSSRLTSSTSSVASARISPRRCLISIVGCLRQLLSTLHDPMK